MADQGYDPVEQRARFATAFQGTTNLDQRRRYAQDIEEAAKRDKLRTDQEFENLQRGNPALMNAVTGRKTEERQNRESIVRSNLAQDRFTWDQEKTRRLEDLNERKLKLQQRQEDRMIRKTETELKDAERFEFDTDAFERGEEELRGAGFLPGSSEYREGVINLAARHPYVKPDWRRTIFEGARIEMDADEAAAVLADIQAKNPGAAVTLSPDGRPTIRQAAKREPDLDAELLKATALRAKALNSADKDFIELANKRVEELKEQKSKGASSASETPVQPATQGATIWRVDKTGKQWEYDAATKQPTGNSK